MSGPGGKLSARERDMMKLVQAVREADAALTIWRRIAITAGVVAFCGGFAVGFIVGS